MLHVKSKSRLIFAHININSIRNIFEDLKLLIQDNVDILVVTETILDDTFTSAQFYMEGFKTPIRLDRNTFGGGIAIYIRENIPSKYLEQLPSWDNDEGIFVELNLRNSKWVLFAGYSPSKEHISPYLKNIEITVNKFVNDYDNIIMMGDFNCDVDNIIMMGDFNCDVDHIIMMGDFNCDVDNKHENNKILNFCESFSLTNIVKEPTCFKNPIKPTCIDLIITNRKERFSDTTVRNRFIRLSFDDGNMS